MSSRFIMPFADVGSGIKPSSGAQLFFFETDGVTPKDTFSDQLSTPTPNANPVISDSNGLFSDIYITGQYKVTLTDRNDSQIFGLAPVAEVVTLTSSLTTFALIELASIDVLPAVIVGRNNTVTGYNPAATRGGGDFVGVASARHDGILSFDPDRVSEFGTAAYYVDSGSNAPCHTRLNISVATAAMSGAVEDGSTDDVIAMQGLLTRIPAGQQIVISGPTAISATLTRSVDSYIEFIGDGELIALSGFTGARLLEISGTITALPDLFNNVDRGDGVVGFASAPSLVDNDVFFIFNPTSSSWSGFRPEYYAGEFCRVHSLSGNNVNLWGELYDGYVVANVDLYRVDSVSVNLVNPKFTGNDVSVTSGCKISLGVDVVVRNPTTSGNNITGVEFDRCYGVTVDAGSSKINAAAAGNQYGVIFSNCQDFKISGSTYGTRHSIGVGGNDFIGSVSNRMGRINNCNLYGLKASGVSTADLHGNVEDVIYSDCILKNGALFAGRNVAYKNCVIYGVGSSGVPVLGAEILGGIHTLDGCELITNISVVTRGAVYLVTDSNTTEDLTLIARNTTLKTTNQAADWHCFGIDNNGSTSKVSAFIDGLNVFSDDVCVFLTVDLISGTASTDGFIVDNVYCNQSVSLLMTADGDYHLLPLRLQQQTGVVLETSDAASSFVISVAQNFRYSYPRQPVNTVGVSAQGGVTLGNIGNYMPIPQTYQIATTFIRPAVLTYDGVVLWGAARGIELNWAVSISEI